MGKNNLTVGGLCSGVGGIELGFKKAGFDVSWANDSDEYAMYTYQAIHKSNHYIGESPHSIREIIDNSNLSKEITSVDVLVSGFPCQPFSIAGYRKGMDDERGTVIEDIFDFMVKFGAPKVLFLENVKNFRNHDGGKTFNMISDKLKKDFNYSVCDLILNAAHYTKIPQNRERTFLICFKGEGDWERDSLFRDYNQNKISAPLTTSFINNLPKKISKTKSKDEFLVNEWNDDDIYSEHHFSEYFKMLESIYSETNPDTFYQIRRVYARMNSKGLCPTLTANMGTGGHNVPIIRQTQGIWRRLTPKECFNLQGFPKSLRLPSELSKAQLYKQAGNSVNVELITKLAKSIKLAIAN